MRQLKAILVAAIGLGLLAGGTVGAAAQSSDGEPLAPTPFTGHLGCPEEPPRAGDYTEDQFSSDVTLGKLRGLAGSLTIDEMSDPRLDGVATYILNEDSYWEGETGNTADTSFVDVLAQTIRIVNGDGAWEGTRLGLNLDAEPRFSADAVALAGEGDYRNLVALVEMSGGTGLCDFDIAGVIIDGFLPPVPDLTP